MIGKTAMRYIVIAGPTASGKSGLAMSVARRFNGEIIGCDSVQLYRGFDIGSAKPTLAERKEIPHYMIDVADWDQEFDANIFAKAARERIDEVISRKRLPIVVGGTGLYLRALWGTQFDELPRDLTLRQELEQFSNDELHAKLKKGDPKRAGAIHLNDRFRLLRAVELITLLGQPISEMKQNGSDARLESLFILLMPDRSILLDRIRTRIDVMITGGLIDEVQDLLNTGCSPEAKPMMSIGYRQVVEFLRGEFGRSDLAEKINIATRQYAKKLKTWFQKLEPDLLLADAGDEQKVFDLIASNLSTK